MHHLVKVPVVVLFAGLAVAGCGGDAESAADLESERLEEMIEAEVDARVEERMEEERRTAEAPANVEEPAPAPERQPESRRDEGAPPAPPAQGETEPEAEAVPEEPEAEPVTIAAGTRLTAVVESDISTRTHEAGSEFQVRVTEELLAPDGGVLVPEGAFLAGRVAEARESEGPEEEAVLVLAFEHLVIDEERIPLNATLAEAELESETGDSGTRTAAKVATGAAAGAIIGQILGRDTRSTVQGAAAGAVAGAGVALTTRDGHAVIREGSTLVVQIERPVVVASGR